jgi:hypothetical protein
MQVDGANVAVLAEGDYETLAVGVVATAAPPAPGPGPLKVDKAPPQKVAAVVAAGGFPLRFSCAKSCTVTSVLVGRIPRRRRSVAATAPVWARGKARLPNGGRAKLFVRLNAAAKQRFPRAGTFRLTLRTTIRTASGQRTTSQQVSFVR